MPNTTGVNMLSVVHKASNGVTVAFPDVCITPGVVAGAPGPLPYPNIYTTAVKAQQKQQGSTMGSVAKAPTPAARTPGNQPGTLKEVVSFNTRGPTTIMMGAPTVIAEQGMVGITGSPALNHAQNAAKQAELAQIRGALDQLNGRVKACTSDDPNAWQALLQEYLLNASALYMTLKG